MCARVKSKFDKEIIGWIAGLASLSINHAIDSSTVVIDSF